MAIRVATRKSTKSTENQVSIVCPSKGPRIRLCYLKQTMIEPGFGPAQVRRLTLTHGGGTSGCWANYATREYANRTPCPRGGA